MVGNGCPGKTQRLPGQGPCPQILPGMGGNPVRGVLVTPPAARSLDQATVRVGQESTWPAIPPTPLPGQHPPTPVASNDNSPGRSRYNQELAKRLPHCKRSPAFLPSGTFGSGKPYLIVCTPSSPRGCGSWPKVEDLKLTMHKGRRAEAGRQ